MAKGLYDEKGYEVFTEAHDLPVVRVVNRWCRPLSIVAEQCAKETDGIALAYDEQSEGAQYVPREEK